MKLNVITTSVVLAASVQMMATSAAQPTSVKNERVTVNGTPINYAEAGEGPLMILIHGALSDHTIFFEHMKALSKHFRVVAYPQRYYGKDNWGKAAVDKSYLDLTAQDTADFVKALGAGPAHLVGWSMGGQIAHSTALNHPEQVKSAYLFEGSAPLAVGEQTSEADIQILGPTFGLMIKAAQANDGAALTKVVYETIAVEKPYAEAPVELKKSYEHFALSYAKVLMSKPAEPRTCFETKSNSVPTALVRGDATTKFLRQVYFDGRWDPCINVVTIKGATHMWPVEDAAAFVDSVTTFARKY